MIITISRDFGAGATSVARMVADRCGYRLVADEIPLRVAQRLDLEAPVVLAEEETVRPFLTRLAEQLPGAALDVSALSTPTDSMSYATLRNAIEFEIHDEAQRGDVVIVGRAASFVLGARSDLLRVFLHAPVAWRIARAIEWFGYSPEEAKSTVKRIDDARAAYVRDYYGATLLDARSYDLTIDTSTTGFENAAEAIISAVATRYRP